MGVIEAGGLKLGTVPEELKEKGGIAAVVVEGVEEDSVERVEEEGEGVEGVVVVGKENLGTAPGAPKGVAAENAGVEVGVEEKEKEELEEEVEGPKEVVPKLREEEEPKLKEEEEVEGEEEAGAKEKAVAEVTAETGAVLCNNLDGFLGITFTGDGILGAGAENCFFE